MVMEEARQISDDEITEESAAVPPPQADSVSENEAGSRTEMRNGMSPIRFQLRASNRVPDPALRERFEDAVPSDENSSSKRLSRPGRVPFPTISEEEFLEVAGQMEQATLSRNWKEAFELIDFLLARKCDERVMEMKARVLVEVGEYFRAVQDCERAIKINPLWWKGHRMHGRSLLAMGELLLAVKAFERAVHINPADEDLRSEFRSAWKTHNEGPDEMDVEMDDAAL